MNSDVTVAYSMDECDEDSAAASSQDTAAGGSQDSAPLPFLLRELHFWYIDPDGREVSSKDQAAVTINGEPKIIDVVVSYLIVLYFLYPHLHNTSRCGVCGFSDKV